MNTQKHIMLKGGQPITVNLKWNTISHSEVSVSVDSIIDDTTGAVLTDMFPQSDKDQMASTALSEFYNK